MKLKRIGMLSFALFQAVFSAFLGLIMALLMKFTIAAMPQDSLMVQGQVATLTLGSILMLILQMAILGFVVGILFTLVYNLLAKYTDGVEIELHK